MRCARDAPCGTAQTCFSHPLALGVCAGLCPYEQVVCLVVDECHRATGGRGEGLFCCTPRAACSARSAQPVTPTLSRPAGNYDIVSAVKLLREKRCKFRVLGLSATPGSDGGKVQVRKPVTPVSMPMSEADLNCNCRR